MSAADVLDRLARAGVNIRLDGPDVVLRVPPPGFLKPEVIAWARNHKPEIVAILRERAEPARSAAALLREGKWPPTHAVCAFHNGHAGASCRRCGAPWSEHVAKAL